MSAPRAVPSLGWPADAELSMPGSKSVANRLLVVAALSGRTVTLRGAPPGDDVRQLLAGLRTLGFAADHDEAATSLRIGPRAAGAPGRGTLHCGNAGTALRFLVSVAAITPGEWTLTGDAAMQRRPIEPLAAAWRQLGIDVHTTNGCPPVVVRGGVPRETTVALDASVSSQFLSSLLLVGGALPFPLQVRLTSDLASADYVQLTTRALWRFGVQSAAAAGRFFSVLPGYGPVPDAVDVDGDWSAFGVWACLAHLTGSRLRASNLAPGSAQADEGLPGFLRALPAGDRTIDAGAMPDQFLDLAVVAALHRGTTTFTGGANLRVKECDRIAVAARELRRLGADVDERPDGLVVRGGRLLHGGVVDPANDHRVAMAFALLGLLVPGVAIADAGCVAKSYPGFWRDLDAVVQNRRCVAVVGMRGAGKSTFARAFAECTGARHVDTDAAFVAAHGDLGAFVAQHGWPAFRGHEEALVADALRPGTVVSTGGGAIESAATRERLRRNALVVWLDGEPELLRARLQQAPGTRPSLTGTPPDAEVDAVLARRKPLYAEVADVRLEAGQSTAAQVDGALRQLGRPCRPFTA